MKAERNARPAQRPTRSGRAQPRSPSAHTEAPMSYAGVLFLQRTAGNRATTLVVQRKLDMDGSWAWMAGRGWATGAQDVWNYIQPRFQALQALVADLQEERDGGAYETDDVDERVAAFRQITTKYDRKISLDEGKVLRETLEALGLPAKVTEWGTSVKQDLAERKQKADEARREQQRLREEQARKEEEARLAEEARKAEELRLAQEKEKARLAEEARKAEEARQAQEAKEKKEAEDKKKREDRAAKREKEEKPPTDEQQALWARQKQGGVIRTELSALLMDVNGKPADDLLSGARNSALALEAEVTKTIPADAGAVATEVLQSLEARVRSGQKEFAATWNEWGPVVELLVRIPDESLRKEVRDHLRGLAKGTREEHMAFLQSQLAHVGAAFTALQKAYATTPDTAITVAEAQMATLAKYGFDEALRSEMETSVTAEVEKDIQAETVRLETELDQFLKANPTKTRKEAGSTEARDAIVRARTQKQKTTTSSIEAMAKNKPGRIEASLSAVEDLLAATGFSQDAVAVARWGVASVGKDATKLRKLLETYVRVAATTPATKFIQLVTLQPNLDDVNWALTTASDDFEKASTYLTLLATITDRGVLKKLTTLITDHKELTQLVTVTLSGLSGAEMHTAVKTLRAALDETQSIAVLTRLFGATAGLSPAEISAFLANLTADQVRLLERVSGVQTFNVAALKAVVTKNKGTGSDILWILGVQRIAVTLADADSLLDAPKFVKGQGEDVAKILESPGATVQIAKDLLGFRAPATIYSYIDPAKGSHAAAWVLGKLNADANQTFWTTQTCAAPAFTGPAASLAGIRAQAVFPPVVGHYAGSNPFGNYGGVDNYGAMNMLLPGGPGHVEVNYTEYDLRVHDGTNRGPRRMVSGGGRNFYTADHYATFAEF